MTTKTTDFLPGLRPRLKPRPLKPPTEAQLALDAWRAAWARKYHRTLAPPTDAAWTELKRHAKTLARIAPDPDVRDALIRDYLADESAYVMRREHPLRLLFVAWRIEEALVRARRSVEERRRVEAATASAKAQVAEAAATPAVGRYDRWQVRLLGASGQQVGAKVIHAVDADAARRIGALWLFQAGAGAVTVEVSRA